MDDVYQPDAPQMVNWRGQSGRCYPMRQERMADFVLSGTGLYLIAGDGKALWAGTAIEIIEDQASRERFRAASRTGTAVLHMTAPQDALEYMKTKWDLEGGRMAGALVLVD